MNTFARAISRRAFTLTEMMVAISVLLVVIIATSKIFGTASQVTGIGQATQSVMQEAAAIERQIRADIERLSSEGFFAIRCVSVRNDVNAAAGRPLLNPNLPSTAFIRADQLVFFTQGVKSMQTLGMDEFVDRKGQATASRVYYGHAFQLPLASGYDQGQRRAHDPAPDVVLYPWSIGAGANLTVPMVRTLVDSVSNAGANTIYNTNGAGTINPNQPDSRRWLLVRQDVGLADDDLNGNITNSKADYLEVQSARSIFHFPTAVITPFGICREIRNGRSDCAATTLDEVRRYVTWRMLTANSIFTPTPPALPTLRGWFDATIPVAQGGDQRDVIANALFYPRAERKAPSMSRVDQALCNNVIGAACSSFIVDWTYDAGRRFDVNGVPQGGTGEVLDVAGNVLDPDGIPNNGDEMYGVIAPGGSEQPWFGMPSLADFTMPDPERGTMSYFQYPNPANTFYPNHIDSDPFVPAGLTNVFFYEAFFGYNQSQPINPATGGIWPVDDARTYTPLPTALRITMTLHDPEGRLEGGREFQFVVNLPRRRP